VGDGRGACRVLVLIVREEGHLEDLSVGGRVILKRILNKSAWRAWTGFVWLKIGPNFRLLWVP
jgi:hypothetical protein